MQQTRSAGMNRATPYLYVIPCILLLGIFVYIPLVVNFFYSTQSFSAFSPTKTFVGLTNYKEMLADPVIRTAMVLCDFGDLSGGAVAVHRGRAGR